MIRINSRIIQASAFGFLILTAILSIGILFWRSYPLELLTSFQVYYLLMAVVIAIVYWLWQVKKKSNRLLLYFSLLLITVNSVGVIPWYLPHGDQGSGDPIRVLTFNINTQNGSWDAIAEAVAKVQPDVATIIESTIESKVELSQRLIDIFPFVYRTSGGGLTILSKFPLIDPQTRTFAHGSILVTSLQLNQKTIALIAAHPIVPIKPDLFQRRNAFLAEITAYIQQQPQQYLIFLGDLNLTPWSFYYKQLIHKTHLHNTRWGFGIEPSWVEGATYVHYPSWITTLLKIPIDHILISEDIKAFDCKTKRAANSDHRMLWSDLTII